MAARPGLDVGPLSWVKHEIDSAMQRGAEALAAYVESGDTAKLKAAQAHLHQAHGALQLVGLEGVTRVTLALEALLAGMESDPSRGTLAARGFADVPA